VQGHQQVRRKLPDAVSIFLMPPSYRELQRRLLRRHSDAPEVIRRRLQNARREIRRWREYDFLVVNDRLPRAVRKLRAVVEAARARRQVQRGQAKEIQKTFGGKVE
jgi:guanylate kinase